jgi:hypothetical protein
MGETKVVAYWFKDEYCCNDTIDMAFSIHCERKSRGQKIYANPFMIYPYP